MNILVLDAFRPKKPGFLLNLWFVTKYFRKKPGFWSPMRNIMSGQLTMIPVGAGSPTIFAKNRQSQKPAPAYVLCLILLNIKGQSDAGSGGLVCRFSFGCRCGIGFAGC